MENFWDLKHFLDFTWLGVSNFIDTVISKISWIVYIEGEDKYIDDIGSQGSLWRRDTEELSEVRKNKAILGLNGRSHCEITIYICIF